jgi:hypothetical protein
MSLLQQTRDLLHVIDDDIESVLKSFFETIRLLEKDIKRYQNLSFCYPSKKLLDPRFSRSYRKTLPMLKKQMTRKYFELLNFQQALRAKDKRLYEYQEEIRKTYMPQRLIFILVLVLIMGVTFFAVPEGEIASAILVTTGVVGSVFTAMTILKCTDYVSEHWHGNKFVEKIHGFLENYSENIKPEVEFMDQVSATYMQSRHAFLQYFENREHEVAIFKRKNAAVLRKAFQRNPDPLVETSFDRYLRIEPSRRRSFKEVFMVQPGLDSPGAESPRTERLEIDRMEREEKGDPTPSSNLSQVELVVVPNKEDAASDEITVRVDPASKLRA